MNKTMEDCTKRKSRNLSIQLLTLTFICPAWSLINALIKVCQKKINSHNYNVLTFFISFFFAVLAFTQKTDSGDIYRVYDEIVSSQDAGYVYILQNMKYPLWGVINFVLFSLTDNVQSISLLWTFVIFYTFFLALRNILEFRGIPINSKITAYVIIASILCFICYTQVTEIMKQAVATSLFFWGISNLLLGKKIKPFIIWLSALLIHYSVFLLMPMLLYELKFVQKHIITVMLCSFLLRAVNLMSLAEVLASAIGTNTLVEMSNSYSVNFENFYQSSSTFFTFIFCVLFVSVLMTIINQKKTYSKTMILVMLYIVVLNLNYSISHNFTRIISLSYPIYAMLFIEIFLSPVFKIPRKLILTFFVVGTFVSNFVFVNGRLSENSSYGTSYMDNSVVKICTTPLIGYLTEKTY